MHGVYIYKQVHKACMHIHVYKAHVSQGIHKYTSTGTHIDTCIHRYTCTQRQACTQRHTCLHILHIPLPKYSSLTFSSLSSLNSLHPPPSVLSPTIPSSGKVACPILVSLHGVPGMLAKCLPFLTTRKRNSTYLLVTKPI